MDDRERRMMEKKLSMQKEINKLLQLQCELLQEQNDILRVLAGIAPRKKENEDGRLQ